MRGLLEVWHYLGFAVQCALYHIGVYQCFTHKSHIEYSPAYQKIPGNQHRCYLKTIFLSLSLDFLGYIHVNGSNEKCVWISILICTPSLHTLMKPV